MAMTNLSLLTSSLPATCLPLTSCDTLKQVIREKFGDGIMSAIDFSMEVGKEESPKGGRVVLTLKTSSCRTDHGDSYN